VGDAEILCRKAAGCWVLQKPAVDSGVAVLIKWGELVKERPEVL